jgi:anthranilate phosphoribosyltransferase
MKEILEKLSRGRFLEKEEARQLLIDITEEKYSPAQIASLLTFYIMRQIRPEELDGFREALIEKAVSIDLGTRTAIDMCGTGGDGKNTFNISTLASLVVAGAGVPVIKHGNYGVSSFCGSSNVLEACGYELTNDEDILKRQLQEHNYCYLHAPLFHPSMKSVGPIRKELGLKTFFNMMGPLVNPVQPEYQFAGVFGPCVAEIYSDILRSARTNFSIVFSSDGYDEISLTDDFIRIGADAKEELSPEKLGFQRIKPEKLHGGDTPESAKKIFLDILQNTGTAAQKQVVLANAAAALEVWDHGLDFSAAYEKAQISLESGRAAAVLKNITGG